MKTKNTFRYHALLAAILIIMHIFDQYKEMGAKVFSSELTLGLTYLFTFYLTFFITYAINYNVICPKTIPEKKTSAFLLGILPLFFVFAGIRYFLEEIIVYAIAGFHNYADRTRTFWFYIFDNSYYALKAILFSTFMYLLFMYLRSKTKIHELQLERQNLELSALKMQLEPHFLFNTLNVFYSELSESNPETAKGIHKLSELLRYLTYDAQKDYMPLKRELKFIDDYVYFYRKRFEDNLFLNVSFKGTIKEQEVPSLLLVHFIENICKHGIINDSHYPAQVLINISSDTLEVNTSNKVSNVKNYSSKGIGRDNLKKRLSLLFGDHYIFKHEEINNTYSVYLKIPLKNS